MNGEMFVFFKIKEEYVIYAAHKLSYDIPAWMLEHRTTVRGKDEILIGTFHSFWEHLYLILHSVLNQRIYFGSLISQVFKFFRTDLIGNELSVLVIIQKNALTPISLKRVIDDRTLFAKRLRHIHHLDRTVKEVIIHEGVEYVTVFHIRLIQYTYNPVEFVSGTAFCTEISYQGI